MPHDDSRCVFHAPVEKKGVTVRDFNEMIWQRINKLSLNFRGFIFPGDIYFRGGCRKEGGAIVFARSVDFSKAKFTGIADFLETQFSGVAYFTESNFSGDAYFIETEFSGKSSFTLSLFSGNVSFSKALFSEDAYFGVSQFSGDADFTGARFTANAIFIGAKFNGNTAFSHASFDDLVQLEFVTIRKNILFYNIILSSKTRFYFQEPKLSLQKGDTGLVIFKNIRFNRYMAYIENIQNPLGDNKGVGARNALLLFRYCQLKDVYFTNNDMSLFSFYKSSFDEARFISCRWSDVKDRIFFIPFKRKNVIPEEKFLSDSTDKEKFMVEDLNGYEDVASLYRRMKTALDNTKDYQQASWFYFNEFEMKRRALEEEIENRVPKWRIFQWRPLLWCYCQLKKIFSRYIFYFFYKVFAGFGEKPLWSFYWFLLWLLGFTTLNYCIGLKKGFSLSGGTIDYIDATFWDSLIFTLYRIIPANYLPFKQMFDIPHGFWGMLVPFLNTAVLIIFIAFIAIGLKRHFRRF